MFIRSWNALSNIGMRFDYDDILARHIRLTNQFTIIAMLVLVLGGITNFLLGDVFAATLVELVATTYLLVFYCNRRGSHTCATTFMLTLVSITIFFFDSYSGVQSGAYLFYFPLIFAIGFLFDFRARWRMFLVFLLNLGLLTVNLLTDHRLFRNEQITDDMRYYIFCFDLVFSMLTIGFFLYLVVSNNQQESELYEQRINERKATEQAITQALAEKDILLAEVHHRVKNNLAIIASLLNLQSAAAANDEAREVLLDSKNRVKSMALIHDRLYKNDSLSQIDFEKYTMELISEIRYSYPTIANNINVDTFISNITLNVNLAIPCGLILNELLSNCYKHAFKGREGGSIRIEFTRDNDINRMVVADDGVGLRAGYQDGESLGMVVIRSLSEQLDGRYNFSVSGGTKFELEF